MSLAERFGLTGKVALVTGARRGLGRAIAWPSPTPGADIVGLGPNPMPETAEAIAAAGRRFAEVTVDLGAAPDIEAAIAEASACFGRTDILVNNAGIIRRADLLDYSEADWDAVMNVNLKSLFFLSQATARRMIEGRAAGRIINIASLLAFQGGVRIPAYTAAKHGSRRPDARARQRACPAQHHRQRHRAGLHGDRQHRGAPERPRALGAAARRGFQWGASARPTRSPPPFSSSLRPPRPTSPAASSPSTAAGWRAERRRAVGTSPLAAGWARPHMLALESVDFGTGLPDSLVSTPAATGRAT